MRLVKRVERAEALAGSMRRRRDVRSVGFGLVWTTSEVKVDRMAQRGERVVADLHITGDAGEGAQYARSVERFTRDPADLGSIYDVSGALVGRVVSDEKGLMQWELTSSASAAGPSASAAPSCAEDGDR